MNYRHGFHAGNHADVLKHVCLLALLDAMLRKPTPVFVLDTHAGAGDYDLTHSEALRTGESKDGVQRLLASGIARSRKVAAADPDRSDAVTDAESPLASPALARYAAAVAAHRVTAGANAYPGSPALIATTLREHDRLACCETQPDAVAALRRTFSKDARVAVHQRDGYAAIKALLPPTEKRGLVLIDPPYEAQLKEFDAVRDALRTGLARWPQAVFAIWYPVKLERALQPFLRSLGTLDSQGVLDARLLVRPAQSPLVLNGSGVVIVNPPWRIEDEIAPALDGLARTLGENGQGSAELRWLRMPA
jgi:23S rRNA (adenine2030-N6)-methyltransferase